MAEINWLHLSDWHQKGNEFDRQVVLKALLKDIREREKINPSLKMIDFVIFSGDIAFSGKAEEYQTATEQFFEPLLDACGLTAKQLFIVPGNHDLDRDEFEFLPHELTEPLASDAKVQHWLTDDRRRSYLLGPFRSFSSFVKSYTCQEQADYVNVRRMPIGEKQVALLGLNSAWMCGRNKAQIGDKGFVILGEPQIHSVLDEISDADLKIAVLHHPFDWMTEFDCNRIENRLLQGYDFILRGHQHKPKVEVTSGTSGNCVIIPAGASYDRRMAENPAYANSYNLVHLDIDTGKGTVFLRRWSDPRNKWVEDIDSCDKGECGFCFSETPPNAPPSDKAPQTTKIIPRQIPPPPSDFKGREEEISDILTSFENGATITGLRGMGGIGKTALALVLAEKIKGQFPDGQIFVDMRGTSNNPDLPSLTPEDAMAQIIRAYNLVDRLPDKPGELRGLYHSVLAGKRVLLLLDNAAGGAQVEPMLPPTGCAVLITSRIKFVLPGLAEKDLDILPLDKSCELLLQIAPRIGSRAEELAKICGRLPLALRNAASALAEKLDLSVLEYQRRLKDKVALLELVQGSFSLSYDLLTPGRKKQWRSLSVFPDDFDRNAATAVLKMDLEPSAEAISDLVRWSLLDFIPIPDSGEGRYRLHDLARLFAESCLLGDEPADAKKKHSQYYSKVLLQAQKLYDKGGTNQLAGLKCFDREWTNIKVGQSWAKNLILVSSKLSKSDLKSARQLANSYAGDGVTVLNLRLHPRENIDWLETGLNAAKMIGDQGAQGVHLNNLGISYSAIGKTRKAIECHEQALKISRKMGNKKGMEAALGNLGNRYASLGEPKKAIEHYEQALKISREIGDRRGEGNRLGNLGLAYSHLGEPKKAIEHYEQALKISREIGDRRGEGVWLGNLGSAYADLGETLKAIEYHEQALAIAKEIGDKWGEGVRLGNLGLAYSHLGETLKAIEYHEQALAIVKEIGDRMNEAECLCNLGQAYLDFNEPDKAIDYCTQSLDLARKIEYRKFEGEALATLGRAYTALGQLDKALDHIDQALKIFKAMEYRRGEGEALFARSQALDRLDRRAEAVAQASEALKIFEQIENPLQAQKVRQQLVAWQSSKEES